MKKSTTKNYLIAFCDLTNFVRLSSRFDDSQIFEYLDEFYSIIGDILSTSNGRIIKFMGDAALIVHEETDIDNGIKALKKLKKAADQFNYNKELDSRLIVKVHFGSVQAGMIGPPEHEQFDIIGTNVNRTATMRSHGFAISVEAFRKLQPETRKLFKKHTPPVTYIDCHESHRD